MVNVLVVDDVQTIRELLAEMLVSRGYEVQSAVGGWGALAILERFKPDVVITDRRMPEMSGEELIRHIRRKSKRQPIILMTGDSLLPVEEAVIKAVGADYILKKPFKIRELVAAIESVIATPSKT